ncbi:MAG TPA: cobyrinate a,c-diamide synthase [Methylomirabilota bacterium]|nr:cobyrinate a,c-diamide synthase [Methylomirabilota bacterium]
MTRALVVSGVASGVGKTSVTLGLLEALVRRGLRVQSFKVGPDFIDPQLHAVITGRPAYTLDGWMCGRERVRDVVARAAADADVAVIEGVMGCFDGIDGLSEDGSTAQVAKWLGAPVVLVLDVSAQARSAAAVALGVQRFDPELRVAGVIANRVGGPAHARWVAEAIDAAGGAPALGAVAFEAALTLPERYLGLVTAAEGPLTPALRRGLGDAIERGVDVDRLLTQAAPLVRRDVSAAPSAPSRATIAVARDVAFQFYYAENLDLLEQAGARLVFWSPLAEREPPEADGLYFGGGYPELHARALADNEACRKAVSAFAERGRPVYAECGGLMYLAEALVDADGRAHPMVGVLPARVRMKPARMTLGYAEVTFTSETPLGPAGAVARGHRFHFATLDPVPPRVPRVYHGVDGYLVDRTLMSFAHLHFASNPALAHAFVSACAGARS